MSVMAEVVVVVVESGYEGRCDGGGDGEVRCGCDAGSGSKV